MQYFVIIGRCNYFVFLVYSRQLKIPPKAITNYKLQLAIFSPLIGMIAKVVSRISVQQLWNVTNGRYSYVLLVPLCFGVAVVCSRSLLLSALEKNPSSLGKLSNFSP